MTTDNRSALLDLVAQERLRQDHLHGFDPNRPDGTREPGDDFAENFARLRYEHAKREGRVTWRLVLEEEVAEVNAAETHLRRAVELLQVSASALKWTEAILARGDVTVEQLRAAMGRADPELATATHFGGPSEPARKAVPTPPPSSPPTGPLTQVCPACPADPDKACPLCRGARRVTTMEVASFSVRGPPDEP